LVAKVIVPVGVVRPRLAMNVTPSLKPEGFSDDVRAKVVGA
jgi:hypothetical protein